MSSSPTDNDFRGRPFWLWLLALTLTYSLFSVIFTWPAATKIDEVVIGHPRDSSMFLWNTWYAPQAIGRGENPFHTTLLFYPYGVSRVIDTHCVLPALLSAPFQKLFGLVSAYNLILLSTFVLSGIGAALIAFELARDRSAAFVSGTLFAFGHIRVSTVMFFNLIQSHWMVFTVWATWLAIRRRSKGFAVLAGVFAASLFYSSYNLFLLTLLFLALLVLALLAGSRSGSQHLVSRLLPLGIAALVAVLLCAPLLVPLSRAVVGGDSDFVKMEASRAYLEAVPLLRYFVPGPLQGEVNGIAWPARQASYLGIVGLGLGLLGILYGWRRPAVWFLVWVSIAFFILSLGPRLNLGSHDLDPSSALPFMLPFHYVSRFPILGYIRAAHRYALVGWLAWTLLAAVGLACVFRQFRRRWRRMTWLAPVMAGLLALGSVIDFAQWPFPMLYRPPSIPAGFQVIAEDPRESSVLEFPAGRMGDPGFSWFQIWHRKPVYLDGELARIPPALAERKASSPLMKELGRAFHVEAVPEKEIPRLRKILGREVRQNRIGWVILSWADFKTLFRGMVVPDQRIQTLDRLIRKTLPVEKVIYFGGPEALKRWKDLRPRARLSQSSIFAIYRLDFENGGTCQLPDS